MISQFDHVRLQRAFLVLTSAAITLLFLAGLVTAARAVEAVPASALVMTVNSTGDEPDETNGDGQCLTADNTCTLRAAIDEANFDPTTPDVIGFKLLLPATITLTDQIVISGGVTIMGPGESSLTVSSEQYRHFSVDSPKGPVSMSGLTFTKGQAGAGEDGGSIRFQSSGSGVYTLTISRATFLGNQAPLGGAVSVYAGGYSNAVLRLKLDDVTFEDNQATEYSNSDGGAVYLSSSAYGGSAEAEITRSTFTNNTAAYYGGAIFAAGVVRITDSVFADNNAGFGGAIFNTGACVVNRASFEHNTAIEDCDGACGRGGAISNSGSLTITDSTFSANEANEEGGAIANNGDWGVGSTTSITNSTISGNAAPQGGGIANIVVYAGSSGAVDINQSTITGNRGYTGGGLYNEGYSTTTAMLKISNSIAAGNVISGTAYYSDCHNEPGGTFESQGYNLAGTGPLTGCSFGTSELLTATEIPRVVDPNLTNNGGPTLTHALPAGSKAIDRIPVRVNGCGTSIRADQRGAPRPLGPGCDVGAYEAELIQFEVTKQACGGLGDFFYCLVGDPLEVADRSLVTYRVIVTNTGNTTLTGRTVSDPVLGIISQPLDIGPLYPPGSGVRSAETEILGSRTITEDITNTVSVTLADEYLEEVGIPATVTASDTLAVRPITITVRVTAVGTEQEVTRTVTATARYTSGDREPIPGRRIAFQVTGGTTVPRQFGYTGASGEAAFTYVSKAPQAVGGGQHRAAIAPDAPADTDLLWLWADLNLNSEFDALEPQQLFTMPTAITLVSFTARAGPDGSVTLAWTTAAEIDNAGFNLYRAPSRDGLYTKINAQLIPGQGTGFHMGASYSYVDRPAAEGHLFYRLEDVDYNGIGTLHDPIELQAASEQQRRVYLPILLH